MICIPFLNLNGRYDERLSVMISFSVKFSSLLHSRSFVGSVLLVITSMHVYSQYNRNQFRSCKTSTSFFSLADPHDIEPAVSVHISPADAG